MSVGCQQLATRQYSDVAVVELPAEIRDVFAQDDLVSELAALFDGMNTNKVVVSFSNVLACRSTVIACLIVAQLRLKDSGGELKLCELSQHMREIFGYLHLEDSIFEICETERDALAAF